MKRNIEISEIKKYCKNQNIEWPKIRSRLNYFSKQEKYQNISFQELFEYSLLRYYNRKRINEIRNCFEKLKIASSNKDFRIICENLKINWRHIRNLSYKNYNKTQMILYIWYFYDKEKNGYKDISKKRLYEILSGKILNDATIYNLIAYYKCGHTDCLSKIYHYENKYIKSIVSNLSRSFSLKKEQREDLFAEGQYVLLEIINHNVLNEIQRIITYIHIVLFGKLMTYSKKNYRKVISFDETYMKTKEVV